MKTLSAVLLAIFVAVPLVAHGSDSGFGSLTPQEVFAKLKQKNVYVFDNNAPEVYKDAHVPGAKWLHPSEYDGQSLPADKSATLIFYCHNEH
ncbi:MAG TPA: rhodanese-like domain-containing protein [Polyangia bacterium]